MVTSNSCCKPRRIIIVVLMTVVWVVVASLLGCHVVTAKNNPRHHAFVSTMPLTLTAFQISSLRRHDQLHKPMSKTILGMGGFNKAKNKQAELAKKMAAAKAESSQQTPPSTSSNSEESLSTVDNKKDNNDKKNRDKESQDRELFAKLLSTTKGAIPTEMDSDAVFITPMTAGKSAKAKVKSSKPSIKKKQIDKPPSVKELQRQKDEAKMSQRIHFESLVDIETSTKLGPIGAAQLVPWVPPYLTDCLVIVVDPRTNSGDLRQTIKYLTSNLQKAPTDPKEGGGKDDKEKSTTTIMTIAEGEKVKKRLTDQVIFISADSVEETQSWLRRNGITTPIRIFSDSQLTWMTTYKVVGDDSADHRWSMHMLVFDTDGTLVRMERNIDPSHATQLTREAIMEQTTKKQNI